MALPESNPNPPFNITRASHVVLTSTDLAASRAFYSDVIGLVVTADEPGAIYLRGLEESYHHSLVIRASAEPRCQRIGLRVFTEEDVNRAKAHFDRSGIRNAWAEIPHQGPTIHFEDSVGVPFEICATMTQVERRMQDFHLFRGAAPQRLDHFQLVTHNVAAATDFHTALGFRVTEYTAADDSDELWGTWMQRKGNTHDIVFTNGRGPRLHHFAFTCGDAHDLIHVCDTAGALGFGDVIDRGPGRHGISNALFVYLRDPDGHRIELFTTHYQAIDIDNTPIHWSLTNTRRSQIWGMPASRRWFYEATDFEGQRPIDPLLKADPVTLESYLAGQH